MNNKYHLRVYKLSTVTTETTNGHTSNTRMKEIWDAPFKDDESLLNSVLDYTQRGFFCRVEKLN
jgi:hypothetical protein